MKLNKWRVHFYLLLHLTLPILALASSQEEGLLCGSHDGWKPCPPKLVVGCSFNSRRATRALERDYLPCLLPKLCAFKKCRYFGPDFHMVEVDICPSLFSGGMSNTCWKAFIALVAQRVVGVPLLLSSPSRVSACVRVTVIDSRTQERLSDWADMKWVHVN